MKWLFLIVLLVLIVASAATTMIMPSVASDVPVLYWITDANPAREEQVTLFRQWLIEHGHTTPKGEPICDLRLDTANSDASKQIIQGVSGVAGDIIDLRSGEGLQQFHAIGLLADVTASAHQLGFDPSQTFTAIVPEITEDGRQYAFPCNVATGQYWINLDAFHRVGQSPPPHRWTVDEFERIGKAYVNAANTPGRMRQCYFVNVVDRTVLWRSLGLSVFNETLTRCTLDDPRYAEVLERIYRWTYEEHLVPTSAEISAFATASGYGGASPQMFNNGNYALMYSGRYMLIQLRAFNRERIARGEDPLRLAVSELPHGGFPNSLNSTRAAGICIGSAQKDIARLFLAYLASDDYNMQIVRDADALPPNPRYVKTPAFSKPLPPLPESFAQQMGYMADDAHAVADFYRRFGHAVATLDRNATTRVDQLPRPPKPIGMTTADYQRHLASFDQQYEAMMQAYRNEWSVHDAFAQAERDIAIAPSRSPFVLASTVRRQEADAYSGFMNGQFSADAAGRLAAEQINAEIQRTLSEDPRLQPEYDRRLKLQAQIDTRRAAGEKVPADWISNPFHRRYYQFMDWLE